MMRKLLFVLLMAVAAGDRAACQAPAPAAAAVPVAAPAKTALSFPETLKEIHAAVDAKSVTVDFDFTNRSGVAVDVSRYDSACSCMGVQIKGGKLHYEPGESGVVRTIFEVGNFSGTVDKLATIWIKGEPEENPSIRLTIRVVIPVLVELSPRTVQWEIGKNAQPQVIHITMHDDKPVKVLGVTSSSPAFRHALKTIEEGKKYDLEITPETPLQLGLGLYRVETDSPYARFKVVQCFATVRRAAAPAAPATPAGS
jgi:hypothetical protein